MKTRDNWKKRILNEVGADNCSALDLEFVEDLALMASEMNAKNLFIAFKQLNKDLEDWMKQKNLLEIVNGEIKIRKKIGNEKINLKNVFTSFLENWAVKHGFNKEQDLFCIDPNSGERKLCHFPQGIPIATGDFLKPELIAGFLFANGYLFKDIGTNVGHGEFTHILQWYLAVCIMTSDDLAKEFKHKPLEIYKKFGEFPFFQSKKSSLWDTIFDSIEPTDKLNSPEYFHALLTTHPPYKKAFPVLCDIVSNRYEKRLQELKSVPGNENLSRDEIDQLSLNSISTNKYANANGILINNQIYLPDKAAKTQQKLIFDEPTAICRYNKNLSNAFKLPNVPENILFLDTMIFLFDSKNWVEDHPDSKVKAQAIMLELQKIKKMQETPGFFSSRFSHIDIATLLVANISDDRYLNVLLNCAQAELLKSDTIAKATESLKSNIPFP